MPVRDPNHWNPKIGEAAPCHYGDRYLDLYATLVRMAAVRRLHLRRGLRVLDVGCGDGQFGAWVKRAFGCEVVGVDAIDWTRGCFRYLDQHLIADAERLHIPAGRFDLAMFVTSLQYMADWRVALTNVCASVPKILVVENLQTPTPPWQYGLPEKDAFDYPTLVHELRARGFFVARAVVANVIDRRWFRPWVPGLISCWLTLVADLVLSRMVSPPRGRYMAILFRMSPDAS